ncbi:toll/interleukin-1 receptor domain-containing protein [Fibrella aquatilis]|uniref:Toll/interleukin-1 receptor domain-containing protein n=1 Tax=Fibrella aquatilis TaxID=2817059 RepID=A0A939G3Z0_9BACT|nr:TIR domain-containing protein [Fibrella aquatilis]MBO0930000.1 toll/interleukin-1 receptor domain-containing protein [Fibrella aquatilis]
MNLFISWSGDDSKAIAQLLKNWIPKILQAVKPYFTPSDIEKGAKWETEITKKLNECNIGIICLTSENKEKPWILFEAGALSNKLDKSKVCPLLFGLSNSDLTGPLATFQTTIFVKDEFKKLMQTINNQLGDNVLADNTFQELFDTFFPKLESDVSSILSKTNALKISPSPVRSDRDILDEILELTRRQYSVLPSKSDQYEVLDSFDESTVKSVYSKIYDYMKVHNFKLKEYSLLDDEEVYDYLSRDKEVRRLCRNSDNLKKIITQFINQ